MYFYSKKSNILMPYNDTFLNRRKQNLSKILIINLIIHLLFPSNIVIKYHVLYLMHECSTRDHNENILRIFLSLYISIMNVSLSRNQAGKIVRQNIHFDNKISAVRFSTNFDIYVIYYFIELLCKCYNSVAENLSFIDPFHDKITIEYRHARLTRLSVKPKQYQTRPNK